MNNRRDFLKTSLMAGASVAGLSSTAVQAEEEKSWYFSTFTKPFQSYSYEKTAEVISELGFHGIEAPVRPKGHVLPERVEEDLPKLIDALGAKDVEIAIMASGINEVSDEQMTEKVLRTAAGLGVKRFRMAYYKYDLDKAIPGQLKEYGKKLDELIALSREVGIKPIYQNHNGRNYVGAPIWDLYELFQNHSPDDVGSAFDIGHATVEGARAWGINFELMKPWVEAVYIKEPAWHDNKLEFGALGEGVVDDGFYKELREMDFQGVVNLHVEYLGNNVPEEVRAATARDLATLKQLLG